MSVFREEKKKENLIKNKVISISNLFTTVFLIITSFICITSLSIVNLFDLTIDKLVIFFGLNLILFLFIFDNPLDYLFFCKNT